MRRKNFVAFMNVLRKNYDIDIFFNEIKHNMPKTFLENALVEKEYSYNSKTMFFKSAIDQNDFYFHFELKGVEPQTYSMTIPTEYLSSPQKVEQFSQDLPDRVLSIVITDNAFETRLEIVKGTKLELGGDRKSYMLKACIIVTNLQTKEMSQMDLPPKTIMSL